MDTKPNLLLLQSGLPKSGNYWLYQILQQMLGRAGVPQQSYARRHPIYETAKSWPHFADQAGIDYLEINSGGYFFRKGAFVEPILDLDVYLAQCSHVWTHAYWDEQAGAAFRKFDRIVYILRDPRDAAISAAKYVFTPFMQEQHPGGERTSEEYLDHRFAELIFAWVQHVGGYLLRQEEYGIYVIFYERLLADLEGELQALLAYLGVSLPPEEITAIQDAVTFTTMKQKSPHHVRKGQAGGWVDALSPAQKAQAQKIAGSLMALLGYPLAEGQVGKLPELSAPLDAQQIIEAMRLSRGGWQDKLAYGAAFLRSRRPLGEKLQKGMQFLLGRGRWQA